MGKGRLYVVGMGPGNAAGMTARAKSVLSGCDVVVGYEAYVKLVQEMFPQAHVLSSGMTQEVARCRRSLEEAASGRDVALVCSGDSGVYGMASPVLELAKEYPSVPVEIVPGVSAAQSAAALLGAPIGDDFATISLSDRLTPWDAIERRLVACAHGDMCIVLYNPRSHGRKDHLRRAADALLGAGLSPSTVCGWARDVGRPQQSFGTLCLAELVDLDADMSTTVFVGNSRTRMVEGRMVTPRGYGELQ